MELGRNRRLVTPVEFLAMVPHIILRYEVEIHTYSVFSTTIRKRFGWVQEDDAESSAPDVITVEESEFVKLRKRNWARLIARVWKDDPEVCPDCGSKLEVLSAFVARLLASQSSPAQDDVIENGSALRYEDHSEDSPRPQIPCAGKEAAANA